jgi:hypothetical protein
MNKKTITIVLISLFAIAFVLRVAVAVKQGVTHPMESDSYYYLQLAKGLSHGAGYIVKDSFWPDQPTMQRMPAWPFLVSIALRVCPFASPDVVMRMLCVLLDSLNAVLVGWLTLLLVQRRRCNHEAHKDHKGMSDVSVPASLGVLSVLRGKEFLLAGLLYAAHPAALFLVYNGESEPLFVALCLMGFILLLHGGRWIYLASFCFGLSCLVRANYVIWIGVVGVLIVLRKCMGYGIWVAGKWRENKRADSLTTKPAFSIWGAAFAGRYMKITKVGLLCSVLFFAPALLWSARNYQVCGHFPVLSTLRGQTFYGGNNPVVADTLEMWGYWVFPDGIPGEKKAVELAKTMSEYELDVYYYNRGTDFVKKEWFAMPRLMLGKLIRAYVPVPWKPDIMSYGVGVYRALIYLLSVIGLIWWWARIRRRVTDDGRRTTDQSEVRSQKSEGEGQEGEGRFEQKRAKIAKDEGRGPSAEVAAEDCASHIEDGGCFTTKDTRSTKGGSRGQRSEGGGGERMGEREEFTTKGTKFTKRGIGRHATEDLFIIWFLAMMMTNVAGVLIFWGCFRFAFVMEPMLIPFAAMGVGVIFGRSFTTRCA